MKDAVGKVRNVLGRRIQMVAGGLVALGAVAAGVAAGRKRTPSLELPHPGELAAETALSVHNAAKSTVIAAVREGDRPDTALLRDTVKEAMREGVRSGADLAAVAVGTVEGAWEIAHLLDEKPTAAASVAALAAMEVAESQGQVAAARIRDMLTPHGLVA